MIYSAEQRDLARLKRFGDLVKRVMREVKREHSPFARISGAWRTAIGPDLAGRTRVVRFDEGVLHVAVGSAALRAELHGFRRAQLLGDMRANDAGRDVADIRFTLWRGNE